MTCSDSDARIAAEREIMQRSHLHFTAATFREREGQPFIIGPHHKVLCRTIDRVLSGDISRLIINVPPGFTKTESAVISLIARGIAINPAARFIHATYSQALALTNSSKARQTVTMPYYQARWPVAIRDDSDAKNLWVTHQGGGLRADSTGGPLTGFRAGQMTDGFTGALIIDDPLKPEDSKSDVVRATVNENYMGTLRSRLAHEGVPIIIIMQRLDEDDLTGFLLKGGGGEVFDHLWLPAVIDRNRIYPHEWTHGRPIEHDLPDGPLWDRKLSAEKLEILKVDRKVYSAQYDQQPSSEDGDFFKKEWIRTVNTVPPKSELRIYGASDYAVTSDGGDYTVHLVVGVDTDNRMYLLDIWRQQADSMIWVEAWCDLVVRWKPLEWAEETGQIRSGIGPWLEKRAREKQAYTFRRQFTRRQDKAVSAQSIRGRMAMEGLYIPANAPWVNDFKSELLRFPAGVHDDQVDALALIGMLFDHLGPAVLKKPDIKTPRNDYSQIKPVSRGGDALTL